MSRPKQNKRTPEQRAYDLAFETDLFLKGYSYREIAFRLNEDLRSRGLIYNITHAGVFQDMKKAMIEWKKERFDNIDEYINQDLKKLDKMENAAWDAWEKSCTGKERVKVKKESVSKDKPNDTTVYDEETMNETSSGNPRFLDILLNIQQRRAKLLGYDAPIKVDVGGPSREADKPKFNAKDIPDDLLFAVVDTLQQVEYAKEMEAKDKSQE